MVEGDGLFDVSKTDTKDRDRGQDGEKWGDRHLIACADAHMARERKGSSCSHHVRNHSGFKTASEGILLGVFRSTITVNEDSELAKAFHLIRSIK